MAGDDVDALRRVMRGTVVGPDDPGYDEGRVRGAYPGGTWERLRVVKRRYDPGNLFRVNRNVPPAGGGGPTRTGSGPIPSWQDGSSRPGSEVGR